jgi:hypothetical protein
MTSAHLSIIPEFQENRYNESTVDSMLINQK